jgi:hypothetical protein
MDTDEHGFRSKCLSVYISVNPWPKMRFSASCQSSRCAAAIAGLSGWTQAVQEFPHIGEFGIQLYGCLQLGNGVEGSIGYL